MFNNNSLKKLALDIFMSQQDNYMSLYIYVHVFLKMNRLTQ
jgi:hypothetical protein